MKTSGNLSFLSRNLKRNNQVDMIMIFGPIVCMNRELRAGVWCVRAHDRCFQFRAWEA